MNIDLKNISRSIDKIVTEITIGRDYDRQEQVKISLGEISLTEGDNRSRGQWSLRAYWDGGMTDPEHDSAYILWLPLVGLQLDMIHYGQTILKGFVGGGDSSDFRVPGPDFKIKRLEAAEKCTQCRGKDKHLMLPEGLWLPEENPELLSKLAGRVVEIRIYQPEKK
jgi:hypothetical protein